MFYRTPCHTKNSYNYLPSRVRNNPCDGSSEYSEPLLKVEITRLFIPGASLVETYCTADPACTCDDLTPEVTQPYGEDSAYEQAYNCNGVLSYNAGGPNCTFDPDHPPLWWLQQMKVTVCAGVPALYSQAYCNALTVFVADYNNPSAFAADITNPLYAEFWTHLLELWRANGERLTIIHCGISAPADAPANPDKLKVEKLRVQFPVGTYVISTTCKNMTLDEVCEACHG